MKNLQVRVYVDEDISPLLAKILRDKGLDAGSTLEVNMKARIKSENGSFLLIVAIMMVVLGMIVGLAIDSGRAYIMKAELQRNIDSAALAAASR